MSANKRRIDVMVSSTSDLKDYREKVRDAILRVKWSPEMMEHDGAAPESALERSLRYVDQAEIYILILGFRYGSIPETDANPQRLSYTELEYRHACERHKRGELIILTFLMDKAHPRSHDQTEQDIDKIPKLKAFRAELEDASDKGVSAFFTNPDNLFAEVLDALNKLKPRFDNPIERSSPAPDTVIDHYLNQTLPQSILSVGSIANLGLLDKAFIGLSADVRQQATLNIETSALDDPDLNVGDDFIYDFKLDDAPVMELQGAIYPPHERQQNTPPEYTPDVRQRMKALKRVVLLGDPGAGKTFTLARLALDYRADYLADPNAPIPIFIPLSTYRTAQDFDDFVTTCLDGLPFRELNVIWLLDALNEMPREYGQFGKVKQFIQQLVKADVPFVVTCRVRNYDEELRDVPDLYRVDLQDLNPRQIFDILTHFIGSDYAEQIWADVMFGVTTDYDGTKINLLDAWEIWTDGVHDFWQRPKYTWDDDEQMRQNLRGRNHIYTDPRKLMLLCRNPFTLVRLLIPRIQAATRVAKRDNRPLTALLDQVLPNNRARLFGDVIDGMLRSEAERKGWGSDDLSAIKTALAFTASTLQATEQRTEIGLADLRQAEGCPVGLIEHLKMGRDAGLITLSETSARFNHQLYQEYFATARLQTLLTDYTARHPDWEMGDALPPYDPQLAELFPQWWDAGGWRVTLALFGELEGRTGIDRVVRWVGCVAPEVAMHIITDNNDGLEIADLSEIARQALIESVHTKTNELNPVGRASAYRVLGLFDADKRKGVNVIIQDGIKLPDIEWVTIPAGEFTYQDGKMILDYDFQIARYPVTYVQFQTFVDDSEGWHDPRWWEGLSMPDGHNQTVGEQAFKYGNHPREKVSWYDAMAFCRWYSWRLGGGYDLGSVDQWAVRLPTEFEWEKVARGKTGWAYPYGDTFDPLKGNTSETGIGQTSAVGLFSAGDVRHWEKPISDLSGNVFEWCLTDYSNPQADAGQENLRSAARRVLRGGSWDLNNNLARAVYRFNSYPHYRSDYLGFRVVRVPSHLAGH